MKTQLLAFYQDVCRVLFSNPQRIRFVVTVIALVFLLAVLVLPSLATLADPISGGVGH